MAKISIIILHHSPVITPYLDLYLKSIAAQETKHEIEVVVMDSRKEHRPLPDYKLNLKHVCISNDVIAPVACNLAVKEHASKDSKYILICNDDLCLSRYAIEEMINFAEAHGRAVIQNAFSNCDFNIYYSAPDFCLEKENGSQLYMRSQMNIKNIDNWHDELINYPLQRRIILPFQYVCFYATVMPKALFETLGGLHEEYISGPDDRDFCLQAAKIGVPSVVNLAATIWHFSGRTMATKDPETVKKNRERNNEIFKSRHGYYP